MSESADARMIAFPVGTEPIKPTFATSGCAVSAVPHSRPPGSTENTPGGNSGPTSSANRNEESGACSGGLTMSVLPVASGAPVRIAANNNGWLKALMRAITPSGSRSV